MGIVCPNCSHKIKKKKHKGNTGTLIWTLIAALSIAVILFFAAVMIPKNYMGPKTAGEFGDMFGAANALFSGLAFVGVITAILLQKKELELQREELEDTREVLDEQRKQLALQSTTFCQQAFDNTFFQMLALHHQIVNDLDMVWNSRTLKGRDCFVKFYESLRPNCCADSLDDVNRAYMVVYRQRLHTDVGHYFRNLYNIVKFVDRSEIEDKQFYTNVLRAQLSSGELLLLFYNCVTEIGREKFKPLVEKYALLKNLPHDELLRGRHATWYADDDSASAKEDGFSSADNS